MKKILINIKIFLIVIFQTRWVFKKPNKADILIYDDESIEELNFYLRNKKYEIFHTRYEQINFYIIFLTVFKNGIKNLRENYKINYFSTVLPKVIITLIDENPGFFKLKNLYPFAKYVSVQIGLKGDTFYNYIRHYQKKQKSYMFGSDVCFVLGENDKKKYDKFLHSKFIPLGSLRNNNFPIKKNYNRKVNKILFISGSTFEENGKIKNFRQKKIFKYLKNYCSNKNIQLYLLSKKTKKFLPIYKRYYGSGNWHYLPKKETKKTYQLINDSQFVVFEDSTLGFEALSKKIKGVCFPDFAKSYSKVFKKKEGFFWSTKLEKNTIFSKINRVINLNQNKWNELISKELKDIIVYSPNNNNFSKTINKFILEKKINYN